MVTAFAPASVSNINCGFDVLGLAIAKPGDEVSAAFNGTNKLQITAIYGDDGKLPYDVNKNTASVAVQHLSEHLGEKRGIDLIIHKKMPFGSGLGSSAASAVAAVVAANALLGNPLTKMELLPFAMEGEAMASGGYHADNVAPSLLGGFTLIRGYSPMDIVQLPVPDNLFCTVVHPHVEVLTKEARAILPTNIPLKNAIVQTGNIAGFVAALYTNDLSLLSRCMNDLFATPYRSALIPAFNKVKNAALYGGALAFGISGSGPSLFAFSSGSTKAKQIGDLMQRTFYKENIENSLYLSKVNTQGAAVLP